MGTEIAYLSHLISVSTLVMENGGNETEADTVDRGPRPSSVSDMEFESPIHDPDVIDLVGVRVDGGLDLAIVCSGPLDESDETLRRLYQKTVAYLREIECEKFRERFGASDSATIRILVDCEHVVSTAAEGLIKALAKQAAEAGVEITLSRSGLD